MQARHQSLLGKCSLGCLGLVLMGAPVTGCSGKDVSTLLLSSSPVAENGPLQLALTARGASGALYRLRQASFQVSPTSPFGGSFAFLSSEDNPLGTTLETTLDIGDYQINLFGGWFLEKVVDGQVVRVDARLLSSEFQNFSIAANEETRVQYRFETNGEVVEFGQGRLIVEIEVSEQGSEPDLRLGDPLQIVGGTISPDSNSIGVSAVSFAVNSPQGTRVEVTSDTGEVCVRGSMDVVQNGDFANQWGVAFGFAFVAEAGDAGVLERPWDLDGGNVAGFAFTVSGPDIMPGMRLSALPGGADPTTVNFCRTFSAASGESFRMPLDSLDRDCWNGVRDPLSANSLANVSWVLPADEAVAHSFDLCISDVRPLLR
jgi:hypothetical protein